MGMNLQRIIILDGPNLNRLGCREPNIYGTTSMQEYLKELRQQFPEVLLEHYQSNHEGQLIDWLQQFGDEGVVGIVFNAGAYTHTSIAIADAVRSLAVPVIEVHLSNIAAREEFRHHSFLTPVVHGSIMGLGLIGYRLAIEALLTNQTR